jgi:tape measure domain-containing protein
MTQLGTGWVAIRGDGKPLLADIAEVRQQFVRTLINMERSVAGFVNDVNRHKLTLPVTVDTSRLRNELGQAQQQLQRIGNAGGGAGGAMGSLFMGKIGAMATFMIAYTGLDLIKDGVTAVAGAMVSGNAEMENYQASFSVLMGSADKARAMIGKIADMAAKTPFEMPQLVRAAQQMLSFGFSAEKIIPMLTTIGDAASASPQGMAMAVERITRAIGQMQAKGKITAEEMMQLTEAGIPAWDLLAKAMGKTSAQVMAMSQSGRLKAGVGIEALLQGMSGKYGGMMAEKSQTFEGLASTARDETAKALRKIGEPVFAGMKDFLKGAVDWAGSGAATTVINSMKSAVESLVWVLKGVGQVLPTIIQLGGAFLAVKGAVAAVNGVIAAYAAYQKAAAAASAFSLAMMGPAGWAKLAVGLAAGAAAIAVIDSALSRVQMTASGTVEEINKIGPALEEAENKRDAESIQKRIQSLKDQIAEQQSGGIFDGLLYDSRNANVKDLRDELAMAQKSLLTVRDKQGKATGASTAATITIDQEIADKAAKSYKKAGTAMAEWRLEQENMYGIWKASAGQQDAYEDFLGRILKLQTKLRDESVTAGRATLSPELAQMDAQFGRRMAAGLPEDQARSTRQFLNVAWQQEFSNNTAKASLDIQEKIRGMRAEMMQLPEGTRMLADLAAKGLPTEFIESLRAGAEELNKVASQAKAVGTIRGIREEMVGLTASLMELPKSWELKMKLQLDPNLRPDERRAIAAWYDLMDQKQSQLAAREVARAGWRPSQQLAHDIATWRQQHPGLSDEEYQRVEANMRRNAMRPIAEEVLRPAERFRYDRAELDRMRAVTQMPKEVYDRQMTRLRESTFGPTLEGASKEYLNQVAQAKQLLDKGEITKGEYESSRRRSWQEYAGKAREAVGTAEYHGLADYAMQIQQAIASTPDPLQVQIAANTKQIAENTKPRPNAGQQVPKAG